MEQEKNKKGLIIALIVMVVMLLVLCILLLTKVISFKTESANNDSKENNGGEEYTYICLNSALKEDEAINKDDLVECKTAEEKQADALTPQILKEYFNFADEENYIMASKVQGDVLKVNDIYQKLELFTEKDMKASTGENYKITIKDNVLYIIKDDVSTKIFDSESVKAFAMCGHGGSGGYKFVVLTNNNNV